jgi:surfeit locus 1 family protein
MSFRRPHPLLLLLLVAAELLFVAAARWQWERAQFKERREREFVAALSASPAEAASGLSALREVRDDFAAVRLHGQLLADRVYLHDSRIRDGEYGVDVYVPLAIEGGHVLVDLGWIAADRSRRTPPQLPPIPQLLDAHGLLAPAPAAGLVDDTSAAPEAGRPSLRLNIVPAQIADELDLPRLHDRVFWPAPDAASGFVRDWKPGGMSADRHRGYALQWASFAVATLGLFLYFQFRRKESPP